MTEEIITGQSRNSNSSSVLQEREKAEQQEAENSLLYEMANFFKKKHPQLPSNFWASVKNAPHGPRIKIQRDKGERMNPNNTFSMTIEVSPKIVGEIGRQLSSDDIRYFQKFVVKNMETLLAYWNGELDTEDLVNQLQYDIAEPSAPLAPTQPRVSPPV